MSPPVRPVSPPDAASGGGRRGATLAVVGGAALWGTTGIAQELGAATAAPPSVAAIRMLGGGLVLLLVAVAVHGWSGVADALRRGRGALLVAAGSMAVFQVGYLGAVRSAGVAIGVLAAIGSAPVWAGTYEALRGRPPGGRWVLATVLSVAAAALLLLPDASAGVAPSGIGLALMAGLAFATYAISSKRLLERGVAGIPVMATAVLGSGVLLSPVLVVTDLSWVTHLPGALAALWLAFVAAGAAYVAFVWGLARLTTPAVTTLTLAEPLVAAWLAILLLGERLTGTTLLGAVLLMVGLVVLSVGDWPRRPPSGRLPAGRRDLAALSRMPETPDA